MTDEEVKRRYKGGGTADENKEIVHEEHDHEVDDVFNDLLLDSYPQGAKLPTEQKDLRSIMRKVVAVFKRHGLDAKLFATVLTISPSKATEDPEYSLVVDAVACGGLDRLKEFYQALRKHALDHNNSNYHLMADAVQNQVRTFGQEFLSSKNKTRGTDAQKYLIAAFVVVFAVFLCFRFITTDSGSSSGSVDVPPTLSSSPISSSSLTSSLKESEISPSASSTTPSLPKSSASSPTAPTEVKSTPVVDATKDPNESDQITDCVIEGGLHHPVLLKEIMSPQTGFGDVKVNLCTQLGSSWHQMANRLSVPDYTIADIKDRCIRGKYYDCCMDVLSMWSKMEPSATWAKLIVAFKDSNCVLANKVVGWLKNI
jgi:hypothetical protein